MPRFKRSRVLVDGPVQWALVRQSLLQWLFHSLATVVLLAMLQVLLGGIFKPWSEHWETIWPLVLSVYVSLVVLLPKFVYESLQLSNRFAGPVLRVRRTLRDLAAGKPYQPIKFRDDDFWMELAQELNAAVAALTVSKSGEAGAAAKATDTPAQESRSVTLGHQILHEVEAPVES